MSKINDLTTGSIFKKIVALAIPVLLTSISEMAYNLTDMFWIGKVDDIGFAEESAFSAIGTAGYILWFAFGIILVAKIGISVKVSHYAGVSDLEGIRRYASNGMLLQAGFGLTVSALILLLRHPLIGLFRLDSPVIIEGSLQYLSITGGFFFLQFVINGFVAINEGLGKTSVNLKILPVGLAMNMILDPLFIIGFRMGLQGAAWATVLAQGLTLGVFVLVHLTSRYRVFGFKRNLFHPQSCREILRIGLPAGIQSMFLTICSMIVGIMVVGFGEKVFAAQRVGSQIEQLTWMIGGGFQTALTVFVGQNFGAKNPSRIRKGTLFLASVLLPYAATVALTFALFPGFWIGLFVDNDPETFAFGQQYLRILSVSQIFMMTEALAGGFFSGLGKTRIPSTAGIVGALLRVPLAAVMSGLWGQNGIWWALNLSDGLKGIFLFLASLCFLLRPERLLPKNDPVPEIFLSA